MAEHTGPNGETLYYKQPTTYGRSPSMEVLKLQIEINRRHKEWAEAGYPMPKRTLWDRLKEWFK